MIIRMNTKAPRTKSPDGGAADGLGKLVVGLGADHVFNVFRQVDTPVMDLKKTAIVMQIAFSARG